MYSYQTSSLRKTSSFSCGRSEDRSGSQATAAAGSERVSRLAASKTGSDVSARAEEAELPRYARLPLFKGHWLGGRAGKVLYGSRFIEFRCGEVAAVQFWPRWCVHRGLAGAGRRCCGRSAEISAADDRLDRAAGGRVDALGPERLAGGGASGTGVSGGLEAPNAGRMCDLRTLGTLAAVVRAG